MRFGKLIHIIRHIFAIRKKPRPVIIFTMNCNADSAFASFKQCISKMDKLGDVALMKSQEISDNRDRIFELMVFKYQEAKKLIDYFELKPKEQKRVIRPRWRKVLLNGFMDLKPLDYWSGFV